MFRVIGLFSLSQPTSFENFPVFMEYLIFGRATVKLDTLLWDSQHAAKLFVFVFVLGICLDIVNRGVINELRQFRPFWHGEYVLFYVGRVMMFLGFMRK